MENHPSRKQKRNFPLLFVLNDFLLLIYLVAYGIMTFFVKARILRNGYSFWCFYLFCSNNKKEVISVSFVRMCFVLMREVVMIIVDKTFFCFNFFLNFRNIKHTFLVCPGRETNLWSFIFIFSHYSSEPQRLSKGLYYKIFTVIIYGFL
jgi:hypothetical protein